ncbi:tyrosine-type recombinase/integrase [Bacillus sp. ISL-51]|uniref:tyrosine-type recombinase/integrase n=1 Tax=Bacteria TaxID=2 RepID=UPI001BE8BB4D|nr:MULTISPECIES: tyrosine-type recombinase/integrase [Bacteria]MBT2574848.1 tyrosine-type recombinase/integrase [Bacillus sp. ISL-51]MBT2714195.1 tyrosine-type recombinase/integrase [Pseudomonas sp. ISL-88]
MALNKKRKRVTGVSASKKGYPRLQLNEALELAIAGKRTEGLRDRTLFDYKKMWRYLTDWLNDNYEITYTDELTTEIFRDYINYMKYDKPRYLGHKFIKTDNARLGLSDTTININLRCLKAIFNYLEREELIEVNPVARLKQIRQDVDLTNCFTDKEIKEILRQPNMRDYVGFRDYCAMSCLLDSGLRIEELLSLRERDVDFGSRFITVNADVSKNRKPRLVPISAHCVKLLLQLITENKSHFSTDRIFLSSYGEPLGANHFNKRLKYYAEKAGVKDKKVTAHVYRHTWAKTMILNGCDPFTLQKIGGWADIRTMRRYIQMDTREMRRSHDDYSPLMNLKKKRV